MLKLLKYEFRKSLTSLLALFGVAGALEVYFLGAMALDNGDHMAYAAMLLAICVYAVFIYVLVRGVSSYAAELKQKSAYLIFMTPHSGLKIMASKYLYTLVNCLLLGAICVALCVLDVTLIFSHNGEMETLIQVAKRLLAAAGIYMDQIGLFIVSMSIYSLLSLLSFFAVAYLAITLSHTLFRDKKWRGAAAFGLFVLLNFVISKLNGLFPSPAEKLVMIELGAQGEITTQTVQSLNELLVLMIPSGCISLGVVLLSLFGCGWMLDQKVSL